MQLQCGANSSPSTIPGVEMMLDSLCTLVTTLTFLSPTLGGTQNGAVDPGKTAIVDMPTVEFRTFIADSNSNNTKIVLIVEVDGSDLKFEQEVGLCGTCTGKLQCSTFARVFKQVPEWETELDYDKSRLAIKGWTDPKTKKFHPVKKISFRFLNIPKEFQPIVIMPPRA
jgi:hypothetical protein